MTPTVSWPIRKIPVTGENLQKWTAEELIPLLNQMRQGLNYVARQQATLLSNGAATFQTIWTSDDIAVSSGVRFEATIIGYESSDVATFTIVYLYRNDGTLVLDANTTLVNLNSPGYAVQFVIVGNHVELQIRDAGFPANFQAIVDAIVQVGP